MDSRRYLLLSSQYSTDVDRVTLGGRRTNWQSPFLFRCGDGDGSTGDRAIQRVVPEVALRRRRACSMPSDHLATRRSPVFLHFPTADAVGGAFPSAARG